MIGGLKHLQNILNRSSVPGTMHCMNIGQCTCATPFFLSLYQCAGIPKKNVNALKDFLQAILIIYIASATGKTLGIGPEHVMKTDNWERPLMSVHVVANT